MKKSLILAVAMSSYMAFGQQTVDFEELTFAEGQNYWNGSDESGMFQSQSLTFSNSYNTEWSSWSGFAYSKETDNTTEGWSNQYSAFPGSGNASVNYAVWHSNGELSFDSPVNLFTISVTNATYTALSMRDGDMFAKQFGSTLNADGDVDGTNGEDWLRLTIFGWDSNDEKTDSVIFYLADFRFADDNDDYIVDTWEDVNLASLGTVSKLTFSLESTDIGDWGMNTPSYFALDNVVYEVVNNASLNEINKVTNITLYPNPASTHFSLLYDGETINNAQLVNLSGQIIRSFYQLNSGETIDITGVKAGMYILQLNGRQERIVVQ